MTGVEIVGALLRANAPVVARVPVERIKAGMLPDGIDLPALLVRTVSSGDRLTLKRVGFVRVTDRVAVTVRAKSYADQIAIVKLVRACCAGKTGDIGGALRVSVLPAGVGPDVSGPASSFEQTQDLRTSFDEPA